MAKNETTAKPRSRTAKKTAATSNAATETAQAQPAAKAEAPSAKTTQTTETTQAPQRAQTTQAAQNAPESGPRRVSVTIPLDSAVVGVAVKAATLPVTAVKKVAQNRNGIPAYVTVGGLAVLGAVEWPVAAVGGLGLAAMRRWGPLKPEQQESEQRKPEQRKPGPEAKRSA